MNAKTEFLYLVKDKEVECATILYHVEGDEVFGKETIHRSFKLMKDYTSEEYEQFVNSLDFEYDSGFGLQELFGMVWFKNGAWAERSEYDGSEWWTTRSRPVVPDILIKNV